MGIDVERRAAEAAGNAVILSVPVVETNPLEEKAVAARGEFIKLAAPAGLAVACSPVRSKLPSCS